MFTEHAFKLLRELEDNNNNKAWFDAHRADIDAQLIGPFEQVLIDLTARLADGPLILRGGKETMYRLNRDLRFARDKTPYKTNVAGMLTATGSKVAAAGMSYLCLERDGGFVASGFYLLDTHDLEPIRDRIIARPDKFREVLDKLEEHGHELDREDVLTAMPRGYSDHADAWFARYLKLKSLLVRHHIPKKAWKTGDVVSVVAEFSRQCAPLLRFAGA